MGPRARCCFSGGLGLYRVEGDGGATEVRRTGWLEDLGSANGRVFALTAGEVFDVSADLDAGVRWCGCAGARVFGVDALRAVCANGRNVSACTPDGGLQALFGPAGGSADGQPGVGRVTGVLGLAPDGDGGFFVADATRVRFLGPDNTLSTLAGTVDAGRADGPYATAQFARVSAVVNTPSGIMVVDTTPQRSSLRRLSGGQVTTLLEFADPVWDLAAEDGGTVLVVVQGAILRVRPQ